MSQSTPLITLFAPPERASLDEVNYQSDQFADVNLLAHFLNAVPNVFLILNQQRQVVFANKALLDMLALSDDYSVRGRRPGEILNCVHADDNEAGCGTSEFCRTCGAVRTILASLRGTSAIAECRIIQKSGSALDLRVSGSPLNFDGQVFSLFAVEDISHEKRRLVLERLFFHDVLNLAGVLMGYSELLIDMPKDDPMSEQVRQNLFQVTIRLIDEIKNQRELNSAEEGAVTARPARLETLAFLRDIQQFYQAHEAAKDHPIQIDGQAQAITFYSDPVLLERVIGNLVKNALEASHVGETVTLSCLAEDDQVVFTVHNPASMPRDVELQVFQRSFSTKGKGRGLGTYSVKLLTERYLMGTASFTTSPEEGTTFKVSYPLEFPEKTIAEDDL